MAKINFKQIELKDLAGEPFTQLDPSGVETECPNCKEKNAAIIPITLAGVIQANLLAEDRTSTPTDKFNAFRLAAKIKDGEEVDFTLEELSLIKKKVGENTNPLIIGRVFEVLESLEPKK
jgi:hypothetical protein